MTEVTSLLILLLLACAGYTAGRVHAQFSYRIGYRFGYRQGYFDGDRASWNRRRRELQAAVASLLKTPASARAETFPAVKAVGTTYTSTTYDSASDTADEETRPSRRDLVEAVSEI
jgi:hypothetical protein